MTKTIQNCYKRRRTKLFGIVVICVAALFSCRKDRSNNPGSAFENSTVPVSESMMPSAWPKQLAFCPDSNEPSELRISIGGTVCPVGKFKPSPEDPPFDEVGVSAGAVTCHLNYTESGYYGIMMVQLIDSTHLKVEVFPDAVGEGLPFTANAKIYTR